MTAFGKLVFSSLIALIGVSVYVFAFRESPDESVPLSAVVFSASSTSDDVTLTSSSSPSKDEASSTLLFSEFVKKDGVYTCLVATSLDAPLSTGEISFNNSKLRGVFHYGSSGKVGTSTHFILTNKTLYSWLTVEGSSTSAQGSKIKNVTGATEITNNLVTRFSLKDITDYSCEKSSETDVDFALPVDVTFEAQ